MTDTQQLFKKPKDVTYTQMSMWLDANFYKENCDENKAYTYIWLLTYMLACKRKYFLNIKDYELFASKVATDVYQRMRSQSGTKIKSALNYLKQVLYFRKVAYERDRHQEVINPEFNLSWNSDAYLERQRSIIEASNRDYVELLVEDALQMLPIFIKESIPALFKLDKVLYNNIYTSCLLSMSSRLTLSKRAEQILNKRYDSVRAYNEVIFYANRLNNTDEYILWHLPDEMKNVVIVILNNAMNKMKALITDIVTDTYISDVEFNSIQGNMLASDSIKSD